MIKVKRRRRSDSSADITPLLDVVFILLVFFMLTAVTAPQGIAVDLPEAKTVQEQKDTPSIISITKEDKIYFNKEATDVEGLKKHLAGVGAEDPIIIQGDQEIEYGLFVEVMDAVRETGSRKIVLSAEVKKSQ